MTRIQRTHGAAQALKTPNRNPDSSARSSTVDSGDLDFGSYLSRIGEVALLDAEEEKELGWRILNEGCAASRERLIRSNLRLVVFIARRFSGRGLSLPDLVAEGNVGLLLAVDRYDPAHGARFSTYAGWWIKHSIRRGIHRANEIVRVPARVRDLAAAWQREIGRSQATSGRPPSADDPTSLTMRSGAGQPMHALPVVLSLGGTASSTSRSEDVTVQGRELAADTVLVRDEDLARVRASLSAMSAREVSAIRMRFGMDGHKVRSLNEIGQELGVSREAARQLLASALQRMERELSPWDQRRRGFGA